MTKPEHIIQYGFHNSGEPLCIGIAPELEASDARIVFEYLQKLIHKNNLAKQCELADEMPSGSQAHTLMHIYGFEGEIHAITATLHEKFVAMKRSVFVDNTPQRLWPSIGIGLFFWKPIEHYQQ